MESVYGHAVNLKQYRRIGGKWQFVPIVKQNGKLNPKLVLVNGEPVSSKGGNFYLDWRESGKRRTRPAGTTPREALDAWVLQSGIQAGEAEAPEEPAGANKRLTIDQAIQDYLVVAAGPAISLKISSSYFSRQIRSSVGYIDGPEAGIPLQIS
jgi:hypothetical protein